jgi:hypothetical protein
VSGARPHRGLRDEDAESAAAGVEGQLEQLHPSMTHTIVSFVNLIGDQ